MKHRSANQMHPVIIKRAESVISVLIIPQRKTEVLRIRKSTAEKKALKQNERNKLENDLSIYLIDHFFYA